MSGAFVPDWPTPAGVRALVTTRAGGQSEGGHARFNLATHVGDNAVAVAANRALLKSSWALPNEPCWLDQVHGTRCVDAALPGAVQATADASFTRARGVICAILTADCLPILLCDRAGTTVAAVHAGWRGLAAGVISATLANLPPARELLAWVGPGIGPAHYPIGEALRTSFLELDAAHAGAFERRHGHWHANLPAIAQRQLEQAGVTDITLSGLCTWADPERFFSYRREPTCGRFANLIWIV